MNIYLSAIILTPMSIRRIYSDTRTCRKPIAIIENSSTKKFFSFFIQFSQYANIRGPETIVVTMFIGVIGCAITDLLAVFR